MARFSTRTSGEVFDLGRARNQRRQIEAEGFRDLAPLPPPRETFAVRRVPPDDQPRLDKRSEMPAQRRRRHAMRADRELPVRRKHHDAGRITLPAFPAFCLWQRQRSFLVEAQQGVQDGQRPVGDAERAFGFSSCAKQSPFMDDRLGRVGFCREISRRRLRRHHGKRQRPPPKGRR
jgi:hypothetical protein